MRDVIDNDGVISVYREGGGERGGERSGRDKTGFIFLSGIEFAIAFFFFF